MSMVELNLVIPAEHEKNVFGQFDQYIKKIERALQLTVISRDGAVKILGSPNGAARAKRVLESLVELSGHDGSISEQQVDYTLSLSM